MRRNVLLAVLAVFWAGAAPSACHAQQASQPDQAGTASQDLPAQAAGSAWTAPLLALLRTWVAAAAGYALPCPDTKALDAAVKSGDPQAVDRAAEALALSLARMHVVGSAPQEARVGWHIDDPDARMDLSGPLHAAMASGSLDAFFQSLQPRHPDFGVLRAALAAETDPARRATLARNMERWRWMPRDLGGDFLLVNAAAFRLELWREGRKVGDWRIVVGKTETPTPVFAARVTGMTVNPWWEIPANIVAESVGALVRRHPALARRRGYVWGGGRYRQRPGPNNALGVVKLVMPNSFHVYLHDTPSKSLFEKEVRAFSHGCVRVDRPLDLAAALLAPDGGGRERLDALVAGGKTQTLALARPVPVYVAYFTATTGDDGRALIVPDIYGRDSGPWQPPGEACTL